MRDEPLKPQVSENEQMSDIVFILDKMELILQAVSKIGKDGKYSTVPADKEHSNSFLKIDRYANMFENFVKNFWSQLKDPTRFGILSVKADTLDSPEVKQAIEDLAAGKQTKAVEDFLKKYEIVPRDKENQSINNQNQEEMAKKNETQQQATQGDGTQQPKYRYNESMINWEELKNFGLSREYLMERGLLDQMLRGYKTNQVVPISMNFGSAVLRTDARLSFQQSVGGPIVLGIHGIRQKPELERPYFGHIFSEEDKKNLLETGNMGRVVELKGRNGEYIPSFISIDKLTNEVVAMRAENAYIPQEIKGVKLTDQEINDLREGKKVFIEGMISNNGKEFDAHIQVNAERRGIEYIFENDKLFNRQSLGGVELTKQQIEDLNAGKAIFVEGMERKDGELFSSYVKLDEATGRPSYTRYNPDSPEGAREIYIPNEIGGVKITAEEQQQLREGKVIFLNDMVNRKGEEFSSFIKADLETGRLSYSRTPDGFEQRAEFKIPEKVWDVKLTRNQRADLQSGKAVLVEGIKGYDGKTISQYVKANFNQGRLDFYNENPDRKRDASQRNVVANAQKQGQEQAGRKSKGASIA
ncbi:copper amine oxidase [Parabacteroides goldsteinii]|nr:copper amine oxidase [Butyricimonas paravirosa]GKG72458.1 copper amine oxidase [Parabacteroides goldsteinii]GKG78444.1 copper amine oxidase [Parabacteroides goldsteinii]